MNGLLAAASVGKAFTDLWHDIVNVGPKWLVALAVLIIAWLLARLVRLLVQKAISKTSTQGHVDLLIARGAAGLVLLAGIVVALSEIGMSFSAALAALGLASIGIGFALQGVLSNLFAGVQLAMTQPIRIDDAVIVENEWGTVEEITSTYVVLKLWDWRRMIVPLTYFIEKPFQNWTRENSALIGSALLYVDYRAPVALIRDQLSAIVKGSKRWDGRVVNLQVTDAKEQTIELRCLMSASSAGNAFDLRCEVREKLVDFLQKEHPEALPRQRADLAMIATPGDEAKSADKRARSVASKAPAAAGCT